MAGCSHFLPARLRLGTEMCLWPVIAASDASEISSGVLQYFATKNVAE